jgi:hypothetical protein
MKTLILAAFIITIGLASCSVTEPNDRYYPQERVYSSSNYDPYYNPYDSRYSVRRVYDYNTGRYYDVPVYSNAPVYVTPSYPNRTYRRDNYRRDDYRRDGYRDNYRRSYQQPAYQQPAYQQPQVQQPQVSQPKEKRYPDGTRVSPDGTVTLPNGEVRRKQ